MLQAMEVQMNEILRRIRSVEQQVAEVGTELSDQSTTIQQVIEGVVDPPKYQHQNLIRNGDMDFTRNTYLYETDFAGGTGEDANVSEEAAHIFSHPASEEVATTGSIDAADNTLTIDEALFVSGDAGKYVIVEGAGAAGVNLESSIATFTDSTHVELSTPAGTTVSGVVVRIRILRRQEDSTDENADANLATNTALKTPDHTRYATTVSNPDFDKTNGWARWSDAGNTLDFPLPYNWVKPSKQYILSFIYKLASDVDGEEEVFVDFHAGLWDNTEGQRKFLTGTQPTLNATVRGTAGATSRDYFVVMYLSDGSTVGTSVVTVPDTNATIDQDNYVELSWSQPASVVRSEIYRKTGATYERLLTPYPASTYYDRGLTSGVVGGFPATDRNNFRAFTAITEANFPAASSREWRPGQMSILVPNDYDLSKTTDKQWLVMGFTTSLSGAGSDHALYVDLISLDSTYGLYSKSPLDFHAKRGVSSAPTSGDQGDTGGSGGGGEVDPGGGYSCPVFDGLIDTDHGPVRAIDLVDNEHVYRILDRDGRPVEYEASVTPPQTVYTFVAGDIRLTGSESHPVFSGPGDIIGRPLKTLRKDDTIDTKWGILPIDLVIRHHRKRHCVKITLKGSEKGYRHNGVGVHNRKNDDLLN